MSRWLSDLIGTLADTFSIKWLKFRGSATPGSPVDGEVYYDSTSKRLNSYDGSTFHQYAVEDIPIQTKSAGYTFVLGDANICTSFNNSSSGFYTIPPNSSVAFKIGTVLWAKQNGIGNVSVIGGSGVTLRQTAQTYTQGDWLRLVQVSTDVWDAAVFTAVQLSLTTTGTSGAATLSGGVLNVPQYDGSFSPSFCDATISGGSLM